MTKTVSCWLRQALSDENQQGDIAYGSIAVLTVAAVCSIAFVLVMSVVDWLHCQPTISISTGVQDTRNIVSCRYELLPVGQACGLIFGAYSALIGALAGYMAATRRRARELPTSETTLTAKTTG